MARMFEIECELPEVSEGLHRFVVTLTSPQGTFDMEIPTHLGAEAACARAVVSLAALGKGDLDDTIVNDVKVGTFESEPLAPIG